MAGITLSVDVEYRPLPLLRLTLRQRTVDLQLRDPEPVLAIRLLVRQHTAWIDRDHGLFLRSRGKLSS